MKKIVVFAAAAVLLAAGLGACATTGAGAAAGRSSHNKERAVQGNVPDFAKAGTATASGKPARHQERKVQGSVPDFVKQAIKNCPEDSIVAAGSSRLRDMGLAKQRAEVLARGEIARQIQALSSSMIRDYAAASEVDPSSELAITEALNTALGKQNLLGARIADYDVVDGTTWVIVELPKSAQKNAINQAAAAAKLNPAWQASLNAEDRMDAAFAKNNMGAVPVATE
jgi:ferredoxin